MKLAAAEEELKRTQEEKAALFTEKKELEARLQKEESELAQTSLDMESAQKAHEQQTELVTQLRGELARVGDHLKAFQGDKDALAEDLSAAEAKVALLEQQVEYLRSKAETSEDAQEKLRGALEELAEVQDTTAKPEPAPEQAPKAAEPEEASAPSDDEKQAPTDGDEDAPEEPIDEVLPEDSESEE
jgi:chromosome segregation ATPase